MITMDYYGWISKNGKVLQVSEKFCCNLFMLKERKTVQGFS